jgi:outer membrane immunogenic protein
MQEWGTEMRNLIRVIGVSSLLASAPLSALAADMQVKAPLPPIAANSWTGFYIGGNVGGAWTRNTATWNLVPGGILDVDPITGGTGGSAVTGGFQEGVNWQFARSWVVGIEADWSFTKERGSFSQGWIATASGLPIRSGSTNMSSGLDWLASARNRLGYLVTPNILAYATGGAAWGRIRYDGAATNSGLAPFATSAGFSNTLAGWVVGGGLEWMLGSNWLLRGEYLYYQLESPPGVTTLNPLPFAGACLGPCPTQKPDSYSWSNTSINVVRAALSYKF